MSSSLALPSTCCRTLPGCLSTLDLSVLSYDRTGLEYFQNLCHL